MVLFRDSRANFFGVKSLGFKQIRGNGELVVTSRGIKFTRWFPEKEIFIPRERIIRMERTRSFLKKSIFRALAKVIFYNDRGEMDEIAWFVKDLEGLERALEELGIPVNP